jgi:hypothetical protein
MDIELSKIPMERCPHCGSDKLSVDYKVSYGHGDSGFDNLRIICQDCPASQGRHNYGRPTNEEIASVINAWNTRNGHNDKPFRYVEPMRELTDEEKFMMELKDRYKDVSIIEFMSMFTKPPEE